MSTLLFPAPACKYGYNREQVRVIMGNRLEEFDRWMRGQTQMLCQGQKDGLPPEWPDDDPRRDMFTNRGYPECDAAHGSITYQWDVERFLDRTHPGHGVWD